MHLTHGYKVRVLIQTTSPKPVRTASSSMQSLYCVYESYKSEVKRTAFFAIGHVILKFRLLFYKSRLLFYKSRILLYKSETAPMRFASICVDFPVRSENGIIPFVDWAHNARVEQS